MASHLRYDRRIPPAFLTLLKGRKPLSWLPRLAADWPFGRPTDLGLRALQGNPCATFYVGTTKAIDVIFRESDRAVKFKGHALDGAFEEPDVPFDPDWGEWQTSDDLKRSREKLAAHVEAVVKAAPAGRMLEGRAQALLARTLDPWLAVVDREVEFSRAHPEAKTFVRLQQRELRALAGVTRDPGDKIDALAIGSGNELFVIEVKPGSAGSLAVTPLQVAMYARLVQAWRADDETHAIEVLNTMADQRVQLGLGDGGGPRLSPGFTVVPVIAVGLPVAARSAKPGQLGGLRDRINVQTHELDRLQVWTIGGITRLDRPSLIAHQPD